MKKILVYPGSFDPVTRGHIDIIRRASKLCDKLVIGVLNNSAKKYWFTPEERKALIQKSVPELKNVEIKAFNGLLIDFMQDHKATTIIRGVRSIADYEHELQLSKANSAFSDIDLETIFIPAKSELSFLSSSVVREVASYGGNLERFVNENIIQEIEERASQIENIKAVKQVENEELALKVKDSPRIKKLRERLIVKIKH